MRNLDDLRIIEKLDQARMREALAGFPEQCRQAFAVAGDFSLPANFAEVKNIVFSGMGGSNLGAEVVNFYLRAQLKVATQLNRDYSLPAFVDRESLVILISYSGNTEETLSAYQQAQKHGAKIMVLTSGGQLADLATRDKHPVILVPSGFAPRAALAFLVFPLLACFSKLGLVQDQKQQVQRTIALLAQLKKDFWSLDVPRGSNPAKKLASRLFNNFCVIYAAGEHLAAVVRRWRGQFAENSKTLASSHLLPEMNHNEIVGWVHPQKLLNRFIVIMLRDKEEHPQVKKRIEISKEIFQKEAIAVEEVWSQGEGLLARTFSLIYFGDFVSFYLAILNGEDPTPVKRIDYLKKRLKET